MIYERVFMKHVLEWTIRTATQIAELLNAMQLLTVRTATGDDRDQALSKQ